MKIWRKLQIMGDWGYEQFFECPSCGAVVKMKIFPVNADATEFCVSTDGGRFIKGITFKDEAQAKAFNEGYIYGLVDVEQKIEGLFQ